MDERKFQVLEQTAQSRCEVCHQADRFDPFTATCMRCQALIVAQALPQEDAARYQQFQQTARPFDKNVPVSDLFRILPEAITLYSRNFGLFLKVCLLGQTPIMLISILPSLALVFAATLFSPITIAIFTLISVFATLIASIVLWPIMSGAITKSILDRYRGENASIFSSYKFIFERGWKYALTSIMGQLYQSLGFFLCLVGGIYTFPRGLFVPEVAIIEEKYFGNALDRSKALARINIGIPLLFGLIWIGGLTGVQIIINLILLFSLKLILPQTIASLISEIISAIVVLTILPIFFTTKLLLYFHLRIRSDEVLFIGDTPKKAMYPMPEQ
ncbi:MAG: hypothetical protein HY819_24565 [Acidobacteria bacterium]|nr:hypothetical protein [Acidobacteriota bacterium]